MGYRQAYTAGPSGDFVYVIQSPHAVKVGVTRNLEERLATLQTGSPHALTLAYHLPISGDAYAVEAEAHATLDRHRLEGEWFAVAPSLAVAAINEAAYRLGNANGLAGSDTDSRAASKWRPFSLLFLFFYAVFLCALYKSEAGFASVLVVVLTFIILVFAKRAVFGGPPPVQEDAGSVLTIFGMGLLAFFAAFVAAAVTAAIHRS